MQMIMHTAANTPSFQCRKHRFSHPTSHYRGSPSCRTHTLDSSMFNILHGKDSDYACISVSVQGCVCMRAGAVERKRGMKIKKDRLCVRDKKTDHSLLAPSPLRQQGRISIISSVHLPLRNAGSLFPSPSCVLTLALT